MRKGGVALLIRDGLTFDPLTLKFQPGTAKIKCGDKYVPGWEEGLGGGSNECGRNLDETLMAFKGIVIEVHRSQAFIFYIVFIRFIYKWRQDGKMSY